jgi:hypothetical protein
LRCWRRRWRCSFRCAAVSTCVCSPSSSARLGVREAKFENHGRPASAA